MKKILIVEDDLIVANIYRNKFSVEGYQVETAPDGQAGLESVRNFRPDALILDLMLPKLSGVQLMKTIRAEADFEKLPIFVFSNTYLTNMVQEAWRAGATKCLSKANCSPKQLLDVVRNTLGNPTANGQLPGNKTNPPPQSPTPAPTPVEPPASSAPPEADFQVNLRRSFLQTVPGTLTHLRSLLKNVLKSNEEDPRRHALEEMYRRVRSLTSSAGLAGLAPAAQVCDALEALLKELHEKPQSVNSSTLRTVAAALDFLRELLERSAVTEPPDSLNANILVVDDEPISRRAVTYALEKARLKSVSVEDPQTALNLLTQHKFDLVFLDVDMPGMNGHELCARLRELPAYKNIPVVFVTTLNNFENRAHSMMSGGNDFITKPFLFIELAVKALVYVLRGRLGVRR